MQIGTDRQRIDMECRVAFYEPTKFEAIEKIEKEDYSRVLEHAVERVESSFQESIANSLALSVNNPSSAVHLALCALDLKRGDKVICAVNAYVDIPEAIRYFDSEPLFVDIDPNSYHMDIDALEQKLSGFKGKKLKAIIVSHFAGLALDMQRVVDLATQYKVAIIEDFIDAPTLEKSIGIAGDIALFSLNHRLDNTIKGAMLAFKEPKLYERAKLLREHGLIETNRDVNYLYDIVDIGCDYRLDALSAYFLNGLTAEREKLIEHRREVVAHYFKGLASIEHVELPIKSSEHIYNYFIIKIDKNRDAFARELKQRGVAVGLHYIPLNFTKYYKEKYGLKIFNFPNALHVYQTVMSLPCHSKMSLEDAEYVVQMVKEVARKHI